MNYFEKITKKITPVLFLLSCLSILFYRYFQIWINPQADFDTSSVILLAQGGFKPFTNFSLYFDIAHPGLLYGIVIFTNIVSKVLELPVIYVWASLVCIAITVTSILIYAFLIRLGCTKYQSIFGALFYLASPTVGDIAARSEENLFFHAPYVLVLLLVTLIFKGEKKINFFVLGAASIILGALHLQPFLIVSAGLFFFYISESIAKIKQKENIRNIALKTLLIFTIPTFVYYLCIHYVFYNPSFVRAYAENFYSIFHNDGILSYLRGVLFFAQGFVITGRFPANLISNTAVHPKIIWLVGLFVIPLLIKIFNTRKFLDFVMLSALGFVFLYEPLSSERWDTFVIVLIVSTLSLFANTKRADFTLKLSCTYIACAICLIANFFALAISSQELYKTANAQNAVAKIFGAVRVIYTDFESGRDFMNQFPRDVIFKNIDNQLPAVGSVVYLKKESINKLSALHINCPKTEIQEICVVGIRSP